MRTQFLFAATITASSLFIGTPNATAQPDVSPAKSSVSRSATTPKALLTAPGEVTEGDRFTVRIRLKNAAQVRQVHVQRRVADVFGKQSWATVKKLSTRGNRTLDYRAVAGKADHETYRVVSHLRSGRTVASKRVSVDVWHWYPLGSFDSYYETGGVVANPYNQFAMNGRSYLGSWQTFGGYRSWESRYTLGRNCSMMGGTFGVTDASTDGSAATIQVLSEGVDSVYSSSTLTPGAVEIVNIPLPMPYRISILGTNVSAEKVDAFPAAGDLQFLCTGLE